jgi:hypothetical protein
MKFLERDEYVHFLGKGDLLLAVNGEASHGTAPLGWDIC